MNGSRQHDQREARSPARKHLSSKDSSAVTESYRQTRLYAAVPPSLLSRADNVIECAAAHSSRTRSVESQTDANPART
jgi:hypothetical protein